MMKTWAFFAVNDACVPNLFVQDLINARVQMRMEEMMITF